VKFSCVVAATLPALLTCSLSKGLFRGPQKLVQCAITPGRQFLWRQRFKQFASFKGHTLASPHRPFWLGNKVTCQATSVKKGGSRVATQPLPRELALSQPPHPTPLASAHRSPHLAASLFRSLARGAGHAQDAHAQRFPPCLYDSQLGAVARENWPLDQAKASCFTNSRQPAGGALLLLTTPTAPRPKGNTRRPRLRYNERRLPRLTATKLRSLAYTFLVL